jgi:hypothetical protein
MEQQTCLHDTHPFGVIYQPGIFSPQHVLYLRPRCGPRKTKIFFENYQIPQLTHLIVLNFTPIPSEERRRFFIA